jgi:hypothetical protein
LGDSEGLPDWDGDYHVGEFDSGLW